MHARAVVIEAQTTSAWDHQVIVGQPLRLACEGDDVLAEAIHPAVEPEAHDVFHLGTHGGVLHVEVRLTFGKDVQVPLVDGRFVLPGAAFEQAVPVVWWNGITRMVTMAITPDVVVMIWVVA